MYYNYFSIGIALLIATPRDKNITGCAVVAGRTDKGVAGLQQVCSFSGCNRKIWTRLYSGLNTFPHLASFVPFISKDFYISEIHFRDDEWDANKWAWEGILKVTSKGEELVGCCIGVFSSIQLL